MNEYEKVTLGRFNVNNLIFSNEDADYEMPKARLEELTQYAESFTETEVVVEAESFNAETLDEFDEVSRGKFSFAYLFVSYLKM